LLSRQYAGFDQPKNGTDTDVKSMCSFIDADRLRPRDCGIEVRDSKAFAQGADAHGGPGFPIGTLAAHSIHRNGQILVGPVTAEFSNHLDWTWMTIVWIPAGSRTRHADFRVTSACPVDRHNCLMSRIVEIYDDFLDKYPSEPLLGAHCGTGSIPGRWQIVGQHHQAFPVDLGPRGSILIHSGESLF
jgi:hypothetical protein